MERGQSLRAYLVFVRVHLFEPRYAPEEVSLSIPGYLQNFWVTAKDEAEALLLVSAMIDDGEIASSYTEISEVRVSELQDVVRVRGGDWTVRGVRYKTGKFFFPQEEGEPS